MSKVTAKDIHDLIQAKLAPVEDSGTIPNLLKIFTQLPATPQMIQPEAPENRPLKSNAISGMIPDIGKIETNMQKNNLMSRFPGLGAK